MRMQRPSMLHFRPEFLVLDVHFYMDYLLESTQRSYHGSYFFLFSPFYVWENGGLGKLILKLKWARARFETQSCSRGISLSSSLGTHSDSIWLCARITWWILYCIPTIILIPSKILFFKSGWVANICTLGKKAYPSDTNQSWNHWLL